jgi:hypothetical protein
MRALLAAVALALAMAAAARPPAPAAGRSPELQVKPDAGTDDDEEDRG